MSHFGRAGPPDIRDTYSLLVLNITFRTTADDLYPYFDRYGKVVDIFIPRDRRTGESRGFAFVRYKYVEEAQKAVDRLDGMTIDGRPIAVQFAKYGRNDEKMRYRDDGRDRDYHPEQRHRSRSKDRERERERDRYGRDRSRDGYGRESYGRDGRAERYDREKGRDRVHERERTNERERSRDRRSRDRSRDRYEADRANPAGRAPVSPEHRDRAASPARRSVSPARASPTRQNTSPSPAPASSPYRDQERKSVSRSPQQRSVSPVRQVVSRSASPVQRAEKRSVSPAQSPLPSNNGLETQSPYNTDPDEA